MHITIVGNTTVCTTYLNQCTFVCVNTGEPPYHNATDTDSVPPNPVITGPMPEIQCEHHALLPGDNIRVELSVEVFKMMQEGHGDYDESLLSVRLISLRHLSVCITKHISG